MTGRRSNSRESITAPVVILHEAAAQCGHLAAQTLDAAETQNRLIEETNQRTSSLAESLRAANQGLETCSANATNIQTETRDALRSMSDALDGDFSALTEIIPENPRIRKRFWQRSSRSATRSKSFRSTRGSRPHVQAKRGAALPSLRTKSAGSRKRRWTMRRRPKFC